MGRQGKDEPFFSLVVQEGLYPSKAANLRFKVNNLFKGINFEGKRMLDIGGGSGIFCFYAAFMGAKEAICLEPEAEGSTSGVSNTFRNFKKHMNSFPVEQESITFQYFNPKDKKFDIILLHNSINHLNEIACSKLRWDHNSRITYKEIFAKMASISNDGANIIICDCSRYNFFQLIKLRNPFAPDITWNIHQSPIIWAQILQEVGFGNANISWTSFNRLGNPGKLLLGNKIVSYFLRSHFCLKMEKLNQF